MAASEFIFISDIPNQNSPLTIMPDVGNTYAKMTYFDSPDFKGNRQAFVFYPEAEPQQWHQVMSKLRAKNLKAMYVWYPDGDAEYIEQVPDDVEILPYIYIENMPKYVDFHQIINGLPHIVNMRFMDIAYKDDKWAFIYLGPKMDRQLRRNLVMGLRSKSFDGYPLYATELMATTTAVFPSLERHMSMIPMPITKDSAPVVSAFRSEFLYLSDVPPPLGHGKILHFIKSNGVKHARVYFVETVEHLKRGFLHLPGLSEEEWAAAVQAMQEHFFHAAGLPEGCGTRINVQEVWFQPHAAAAPHDGQTAFQLTDYYFLYNIPRGVSEQLLVHGCGSNRVRIQLFDPSTPESRPTLIGFAVRLASAPDRQAVEDALEAMSRKRFGDSTVFVDRIWLATREPAAPPRIALSLTVPASDCASGFAAEICSFVRTPAPELCKAPLLFLHGLPPSCSSADLDLLKDVLVARTATFTKSLNDTRCIFIQPTYPDRHSFCSALASLYVSLASSRLGAEVTEVFKEERPFEGEMPEGKLRAKGMVRSCFLFISNLPPNALDKGLLDDVPHIEEHAELIPSPSHEQSLVVLLSSSDEAEIAESTAAVQSKSLSGRRPNVQRLWLSSVEPHGFWPSYRAPCQVDESSETMEAEKEEEEEEKEEEEEEEEENEEQGEVAEEEKENSFDAADEIVVRPSGECRDVLPATCVVVDGLPLLTNDKNIYDMVADVLRDPDGDFCVLRSPSAQSNRLVAFAGSLSEAQSLLRDLGSALKKRFRHRPLHVRIGNSLDNPDDLIPMSQHLAAQFRCSTLLVYGLPRLAAQYARAQLRQALDPSECSLELKWNGKNFLGHGVLTCKSFQSANSTYKLLQSMKLGNMDLKVKFLAK